MTAPSDYVAPPLVQYTPEFERQAADELKKHRPEIPAVAALVDDYGNLRAAIRAAHP